MNSNERTIDGGGPTRRFAVIGAGIAGIACARTLAQAGHSVSVFERRDEVGGRMASLQTPFGSFDEGAQYFTVRDERFERALGIVPDACRPWSANSVRVLDAAGRSLAAALPAREPHRVGVPAMDALPRRWAEPLRHSGALRLQTAVTRLERNDGDGAQRWRLHTSGPDGAAAVERDFDAVLLALPAGAARALLGAGPDAAARPAALIERLEAVRSAPCWTLLLAFPNAAQPNLTTLGPHWNAARSTHHRIAWLARESSKPARSSIERWTVQASGDWSQEHLDDDAQRVQAKLLKAFSEITGIRAQPGYTALRRWREARTLVAAGRTHLWDERLGIGACGDWCLGHRVEDAFCSGLELALAVL